MLLLLLRVQTSLAIQAWPNQRQHPVNETNPGLPIPDTYGQDRLELLPQDANHLFAYWELSGSALGEARASIGEEGMPVLVVHGPHGTEQRDINLAGGNYYLTVDANADYQAELALRDSKGQLVSMVSSDTARTAANSPSPHLEETWMAIDDHFDQMVLEQTQLPGGAMSSALLTQELRTRLWQETTSTPLSSGDLLSSGDIFGSHSVGSHAMLPE